MRLFNFFAIAFLLVGALAFSACTDTETVTETVPGDPVTVPVTEYVCADGTTQESLDMCPEVYDEIGMLDPGECWEDGDGDAMLQGTDGNDCIHGQGGNDSIKGMGGNDQLDGGSGNDKLYGGPGDDELIGGSGTNTLDGGEDTDIVVYHSTREGASNPMQVWVRLKTGEAAAQYPATTGSPLDSTTDSGIARDTLIDVENVKGTFGNDEIDGNDMPNLLKGLDGADKINGHGGDDTILPNRPAGMNAAGMATTNVADTGATPPEVDGIDVVDGGEGSGDTISYEGEDSAVTIDLSATESPGFIAAVDDDPGTTDDETDFAHLTATTSDGNADVVDRIKVVNRGTAEEPKLESTIENLTGGFGGDTLTGDVRANILIGGAGDDTLNGEASPAAETTTMGGNDTLNGGSGADTLNGGPGDDMLNGGSGTDDSTAGDTLNGNAGDDTLIGGGGTNTLDGGAGADKYIVSKGDNSATTVTFSASDGDKIYLKGFTRAEFDAVSKNDNSTMLQYEVDGTQTPIVTLTGGDGLSAADDVKFME